MNSYQLANIYLEHISSSGLNIRRVLEEKRILASTGVYVLMVTKLVQYFINKLIVFHPCTFFLFSIGIESVN